LKERLGLDDIILVLVLTEKHPPTLHYRDSGMLTVPAMSRPKPLTQGQGHTYTRPRPRLIVQPKI